MNELTFDLVVATVGRSSELETLFDSLEAQSHLRFRVVVVDQNDDDRLLPILSAHSSLDVLHLKARSGLSRARNATLERLEASVIAFPDDDCVYPVDILERVAAVLTARPELDGLLGRTVSPEGRSSDNWATEPMYVDQSSVWHCANSNAIFLRSSLVEKTGLFDESLGLGSATAWSSGEETEYLVRALSLGARMEYDPGLVVVHTDRRPSSELGLRDGASVGYILGKHSYPARAVAKMALRPVGGAIVALTRRDLAGARFHVATLRGRAIGYRAGLRSARASG